MPRISSEYNNNNNNFPSLTIPRRRRTSTSSPPSPHTTTNTTMSLKTLIHDLVLPRISRFLRALTKLKSAVSRVFRETDHFFQYLWDSDLAVDIIKTKRRKSMKYKNKVLFGSFRLHYNWCSSSHVRPIDFSTAGSSVRNSSAEVEVNNLKNPGLSSSVTGRIGSFHSSSGQIYYDSTWNSLYSTDEYGDGYINDSHHHHHNQKVECEAGGAVSGRSRRKGVVAGGVDNRSDEEFESPYAQQLSSYLQWLEEKGQNGNVSSDGEITIMNEIDQLADMFIASCHEKFRLEKIESYRRYQEMLARSM